ncbi:MAG: hypothetical protein WCK60_03190 [Candidatus Nomurabacteria bacterium]
MKKNSEFPARYYTYLKKRECRNCGKPIADQEHAGRTYCPKIYDEYDKVVDCKTTLARINDQPDRNLHRNLINDQKFFSNRIKTLVEKKGFEVYTDDLTAYDIKLSNAVNMNLTRDGILTTYFFNYSIISNPITNKHKIQYNG